VRINACRFVESAALTLLSTDDTAGAGRTPTQFESLRDILRGHPSLPGGVELEAQGIELVSVLCSLAEQNGTDVTVRTAASNSATTLAKFRAAVRPQVVNAFVTAAAADPPVAVTQSLKENLKMLLKCVGHACVFVTATKRR